VGILGGVRGRRGEGFDLSPLVSFNLIFFSDRFEWMVEVGCNGMGERRCF